MVSDEPQPTSFDRGQHILPPGPATLAARLRRLLRRAPLAAYHASATKPALLLDPAFLRQLESLAFAARGTRTAGLIGEHASRRRASSVDFADYRSYVPGDDFRLIDWNVYARLGELCLKLTQARENVVLYLVLDASRSMTWGEPVKFLFARRLAAALGVIALSNYDSVVLTVWRDGGDQRFPLLRGKSSIHRLLEFLNTLEASGVTDLRASASAFCSRPHHGGIAVVLSDLWDGMPAADTPTEPAYDSALHYLRRAGLQPIMVHVLDPQELQPQLEGALELVDCESGRTMSVVATPALLARYQAAIHARLDAVRAVCLSLRSTYVPVRTTDAVETVLLQNLRQLAVVK